MGSAQAKHQAEAPVSADDIEDVAVRVRLANMQHSIDNPAMYARARESARDVTYMLAVWVGMAYGDITVTEGAQLLGTKDREVIKVGLQVARLSAVNILEKAKALGELS